MSLGAPRTPVVRPLQRESRKEVESRALSVLVQGLAGRVDEKAVCQLLGLKEDPVDIAVDALQEVEHAIQSGENIGRVSLAVGRQLEKLKALRRFRGQRTKIQELQQRQHQR